MCRLLVTPFVYPAGSHPLQAHSAGEEGQVPLWLTCNRWEALRRASSDFLVGVSAGVVLRVPGQQAGWSSDDGVVLVSRSGALLFSTKTDVKAAV